jgi:hypothetical protein
VDDECEPAIQENIANLKDDLSDGWGWTKNQGEYKVLRRPGDDRKSGGLSSKCNCIWLFFPGQYPRENVILRPPKDLAVLPLNV